MIPVTYCYRWQNDDEAVRRANLESLAKQGVKRLVLTCGEIENIIHRPELLFAYKNDFAQAGLKFVDAHAPWGLFKDPGMPFKETHEAIILRQKSAILICEQLGVTSMAYHTGNTYPSVNGIEGTFTMQDYKDALRRALDELLPFAEKHGVVMALDNILALFLQPLFGTLSDKHKGRSGRRTPFIRLGAFVAAIAPLIVTAELHIASVILIQIVEVIGLHDHVVKL